MDFQLTKDEEKLKRSFADFCDRELKPMAEKTDSQGGIPESHWKALADQGYLGFGFDPEQGGKGRTLALWACLGEHLARCCPSTFVSVNASSHLFGCMVRMFGTAEQKAKYLPALSAGTLKAALAVTDTKSSADGQGRTVAEPVGDGFALSGIKPYVINGPVCHVALVTASIDPDSSALFIVDAARDGFIRGERRATLGVRGAQIGSLEFARCPVGKDGVLGGEGRAFSMLHALQCLWWAIFGIGIGQACIDAAIEHATARKVFGKRISKHQEVHMKIAEMHLYTDTARLLAFKAAWQLDQGHNEGDVAQAAKVLATEMAARCSHQALQIHGGKGYFQGVPVERIYRDARLGELIGETSELLRVELAQSVYEQFRS